MAPSAPIGTYLSLPARIQQPSPALLQLPSVPLQDTEISNILSRERSNMLLLNHATKTAMLFQIAKL